MDDEFFTTSMDGAFFMRTLTCPTTGQVIRHGGKDWKVRYAWGQEQRGRRTVYCAELVPVDEPDRRSRLPHAE